MVTNETLLHKNPVTGKPQVIGLGWLDDSMTPHGPTEEDRTPPGRLVAQTLHRLAHLARACAPSSSRDHPPSAPRPHLPPCGYRFDSLTASLGAARGMLFTPAQATTWRTRARTRRT